MLCFCALLWLLVLVASRLLSKSSDAVAPGVSYPHVRSIVDNRSRKLPDIESTEIDAVAGPQFRHVAAANIDHPDIRAVKRSSCGIEAGDVFSDLHAVAGSQLDHRTGTDNP